MLLWCYKNSILSNFGWLYSKIWKTKWCHRQYDWIQKQANYLSTMGQKAAININKLSCLIVREFHFSLIIGQFSKKIEKKYDHCS